MTETLSVPIGPNVSIDGGPFHTAEGDGINGLTDPDSGEVHLIDHNNDGFDAPVEDIEDDIVSEIEDGEPIYLSTGCVGDMAVGRIDIPLLEGYRVEIHNLSSDSYPLHFLNQDPMARRSIQRELNNHGGVIESID